MQTRNRKFAVKVYEKVEQLKREIDSKLSEKKAKKSYVDKFDTIAKKAPVLVRTAGLAQTVGFMRSKAIVKTSSDEKIESEAKIYERFLKDLSDVVGYSSIEEFAKESRETNLSNYLILTQNTLAALQWFKRFSESVLGGQSDA